jgi:hypothetical protein
MKLLVIYISAKPQSHRFECLSGILLNLAN